MAAAMSEERTPADVQPERVAFVTVLRDGAGPSGGQSALDADALEERLRQPDAAFRVVAIDARRDVAEQIDEYLSSRADDPPPHVAFYASAEVTESEGELLLQLDPEHLETGDALVDIIGELTDPELRPQGAMTLVLLELRTRTVSDPVSLAELAALAKEAARNAPLSVELIVAVRSFDPLVGAATSCSPLSRAILNELDDIDPTLGLYASEMVEKAFERARAVGQPGALAYSSLEDSFPFLIAEEATAQAPSTTEEDGGGEPEEGEPSLEPRTMPSAQPPSGPVSPGDDEAEPPPSREDTLVERRSELALRASGAPEAADLPRTPDEMGPDSLRAGHADLGGRVSANPSTRPSGPSEQAPPSIPPARPSTPPIAGDVLKEADRLASDGEDEEAIARYRRALGLVGTSLPASEADAERARIHLRIAEVLLRMGKGREAVASFEKALSLGPQVAGAERALRMLLNLYLGEGDRRGVSSVEERLVARLDPHGPEIVQILIAFGRAWMMDLGDPLRARERLEHARALAPNNREAIRLLRELAEKDGRVEDALALRRAYTELDPDAASRAAAVFELGRELLSKGREDEALDLFDAALESDPSALEPLKVLSEFLGERQEWSELEAAYRRMLERAERLEPKELSASLAHELHKRLGILLMEHLEDPEQALAELERASELRPTDPGSHRAAAVLSHQLGRAEDATRHLDALVASDPRDVDALRLLFDVFVRSEQIERAVDVARVLVLLGADRDRERVMVSAHESDDRSPPTGTFSDEDWVALRAPLDASAESEGIELVAGVFRAAGNAIVKAFAHLAARADKLPPLDEKFRVDPEKSTVSAARSLFWASRVVGITPPAIYLEDSSVEGMTAVLRESPVTVVGAAALRGRSLDELRFLSGHHLAAHLTEHRIVRLAPAIDDLAACFLAAVVVAVPDTPVPERIRSLVELIVPAFAAFLEPENEAALEEAVMAFDAAGARADLVAYQRAVERASVRAGLVLCNSVEVAFKSVALLTQIPTGGADREAELLGYSVSRGALELRARLHG